MKSQPSISHLTRTGLTILHWVDTCTRSACLPRPGCSRPMGSRKVKKPEPRIGARPRALEDTESCGDHAGAVGRTKLARRDLVAENLLGVRSTLNKNSSRLQKRDLENGQSWSATVACTDMRRATRQACELSDEATESVRLCCRKGVAGSRRGPSSTGQAAYQGRL